MPGKKRSRGDDVTAHPLTPKEIKVKSLKFLDKSSVPNDAVVFKEFNRHYVIQNGIKTQVFTFNTLTQKRYQYYSGQDIPENAIILGMGTKHNKNYVIEDGKKIAVFSRCNLSKFHLALNDGQEIDPQTTVYLDEPNILYIEDDAQKKFVSQVRKIPCNRQEVSSVKESSIPTPDGTSGPQPISPGALGMFAVNRRSPQVPNRTVPMEPMIPISPEKHVSLVDCDSSVFDSSVFDSSLFD
ncbi:MAG TPA: hypothetical protein DDY37_06605 [Legionella sp.]|nr:hypothetical protein [Legionella sp.]